MTEVDFTKPGPLMAGKRGLVMGVANDRSIAWGISKVLHGQGAKLAFSYQDGAFGRRALPLAKSIGSEIIEPCNVLDLTEDYSTDEFQKVVDVNLNGVFYGMKHVLKVMKKQGFGSIVNSASVGGIRGVGNQSGYSASKHGVVGLTRNSGIEYGQYGISIKAIAPGAIMTPMVEGSLKQMDPDNWEEVGKQFVEPNPMKRFGKPEEVGYLVAFLLSDQSNFINATVIPIDGGQSYKY